LRGSPTFTSAIKVIATVAIQYTYIHDLFQVCSATITAVPCACCFGPPGSSYPSHVWRVTGSKGHSAHQRVHMGRVHLGDVGRGLEAEPSASARPQRVVGIRPHSSVGYVQSRPWRCTPSPNLILNPHSNRAKTDDPVDSIVCPPR
jgi:hypothetical protein